MNNFTKKTTCYARNKWMYYAIHLLKRHATNALAQIRDYRVPSRSPRAFSCFEIFVRTCIYILPETVARPSYFHYLLIPLTWHFYKRKLAFSILERLRFARNIFDDAYEMRVRSIYVSKRKGILDVPMHNTAEFIVINNRITISGRMDERIGHSKHARLIASIRRHAHV